jgi:hypothetical protein
MSRAKYLRAKGLLHCLYAKHAPAAVLHRAEALVRRIKEAA